MILSPAGEQANTWGTIDFPEEAQELACGETDHMTFWALRVREVNESP